jgi:hypothetical protein
MDGNNSCMFGTRSERLQPSTTLMDWQTRQELQRYGFSCA